VRRLGAVLGKLARVDAGGAERDGGELVLEGPEVEVALAVLEVEEREAEPLPEGRPLRRAPIRRWSSALIGRRGTRSSAVSRKMTFLWP